MSDKYQVIKLLLEDMPVNNIADELGITRAKVLRYARELKEAKENGTVETLVSVDSTVLDEALAIITERAPDELKSAVAASTRDISKMRTLAESLQTDLANTANVLNKRICRLANIVDNPTELSVLADSLCKLQTAFFNKSVTNVQINNNGNSETTYDAFLSDEPASYN